MAEQQQKAAHGRRAAGHQQDGHDKSGPRKGGQEKTRSGGLAEYHRRRDFSRTREPSGRPAAGPGEREAPAGETHRFVIQLHDATRMHFDFRLEVDGVLKSWAVPKGPSDDPQVKRLASPTEDHPLEYAEFEGTIPKGEYGGGTVIIWDEGDYRNLTTDRRGHEVPMDRALRDGHASFWMDGARLHGGWSLTRMEKPGQKEAWLLVKRSDERSGKGAAPATPRRARSARTGRTLGQVAREEG